MNEILEAQYNALKNGTLFKNERVIQSNYMCPPTKRVVKNDKIRSRNLSDLEILSNLLSAILI